ncbi:MAG: biotin transporter BioY [Rhodoluna sp.]|nr:biotin transporter BioY [Rhodoluna sp.]MBP6186608.1 biotin transporter BioY [Rhodoluna sp.]
MSIALTHRSTVVDRFVKKSLTADVALVLIGTTVTALAAQLAIPNEPVPFTFQTLAVLLVGSTLGAIRGALSLGLYALIGGLGLPVFTAQEHGFDYLFGATGGYIVGFILAAALVGWLAEKGWSSSSIGMIASYVLGSVVIYGIGASWLTYGYLGGDWNKGLNFGVLPFLVWDAIKAFVAAAIVPEAWRLANKFKNN